MIVTWRGGIPARSRWMIILPHPSVSFSSSSSWLITTIRSQRTSENRHQKFQGDEATERAAEDEGIVCEIKSKLAINSSVSLHKVNPFTCKSWVSLIIKSFPLSATRGGSASQLPESQWLEYLIGLSRFSILSLPAVAAHHSPPTLKRWILTDHLMQPADTRNHQIIRTGFSCWERTEQQGNKARTVAWWTFAKLKVLIIYKVIPWRTSRRNA